MRNVLPPIILGLLFFVVSPAYGEPGRHGASAQTDSLPFKAGEKLTYTISWSDILQAGTAVMEVREEKSPDGAGSYRLISTARSTGLVSKFYKVSDTVESIIDAEKLNSLWFNLDQRHGKRKKKRKMTFDHGEGTVSVSWDGAQNTYSVPADVQDPLSSVYYVRTRKDFIVGKPIIVNVHEDGKTWAVEVQTLGKERIKTSFGEFDTIKLKTYPKYEGVFQHKGEIYIWITDDARKIPVLMKSVISIGSIVSTLVDMRIEEEKK